MARRRRRHRRYRGLGDLVQIPGLSDLPFVNRSVNSTDVLVGGAVGFVASKAVEGAAAKFGGATWVSMAGSVGKFMPLLSSGAAAAALWYAQKKNARGTGHAVGALAAGVAMTAANLLRGQTFFGISFNEVVAVDLGSYRGLLVNDSMGGMIVRDGYNLQNGYNVPGYNGMLVRDNSDQRAMSDLARLSMSEDYDGLADLTRMR